MPSWLCGGKPTTGIGPATEVGYNALHTRLGVTLENTRRLTEGRRPAGTENHFEAWETLTHADNPNRGQRLFDPSSHEMQRHDGRSGARRTGGEDRSGFPERGERL
ncbi:hypothetical protein [Streptomyces virginiae]|uniref:hypothetical protein n=1 Tax=Streptomyces virginiae TaxID=1961 RepID=UPI0038677364